MTRDFRGTSICAAAGPFGLRVGSDRMGRGRERRAPSWGRPPGWWSVAGNFGGIRWDWLWFPLLVAGVVCLLLTLPLFVPGL